MLFERNFRFNQNVYKYSEGHRSHLSIVSLTYTLIYDIVLNALIFFKQTFGNRMWRCAVEHTNFTKTSSARLTVDWAHPPGCHILLHGMTR